MKFEYEINELTTQTQLVNACKIKFEEYKAEQARLKIVAKLEKAFKLIVLSNQTIVECTQLFYDNASVNDLYIKLNIQFIVNQSLPVDKFGFIFDSQDTEKVFIAIK